MVSMLRHIAAVFSKGAGFIKSLIICVSTSHGNTRRIADRMAEVLDAEVVEPESVDPETIREYDLVGFGYGICYMAVHARLRDLIRRLPHADGVRAFTFFTSGAREIPLMDCTKTVRKLLESEGFQVLDSFSCRAGSTLGHSGSSVGSTRDGRTTTTWIGPRRSRQVFTKESRAPRLLHDQCKGGWATSSPNATNASKPWPAPTRLAALLRAGRSLVIVPEDRLARAPGRP